MSVPAKKRKKPRVPDAVFSKICMRLSKGEALRPMCDKDAELPSWHTVLRHVREDEEADKQYREARVLQSEDKFIRQLAPSGVRDKPEDSGGAQGGTLVIQWGQKAEPPAMIDVTNAIDHVDE